MVEDAKFLQVGDICHLEVHIVVSVTNTVITTLIQLEVVLSFLYHCHFVDYKNTFETTEESDYLVHADVGVLQSKECKSSLLLAGTSLIFCIQS